MARDTPYTCVICNAACIGYGNNPDPVNDLTLDDGVCCDDCNTAFVIPTRLAHLTQRFNAGNL